MKSHTRKEALGSQRQSGTPQRDGRPLELHRDPMPQKSKAPSQEETPLRVGEGVNGLGPMPWKKVH